jgi:hypothetical protein
VISIPPERKEVARPVIPNILRKTKIATLNQSFVSKAFGFMRKKLESVLSLLILPARIQYISSLGQFCF